MSFVLSSTDAHDRNRAGGKAAALATLADAGLPVPPWFVVTADALAVSLGEERLAELADESDPAMLRETLRRLSLSPEVATAIETAVAQVAPDDGGGGCVAVRSSAADEDGQEKSFAGQFDSFLFVEPDDVPAFVVKVWLSGLSERVLAYRGEGELDVLRAVPAVLVQRMVDAEVAGVAFSADPVSGRRQVAVVSAVWGLGSQLVGGDADADTFHVSRDGQIVGRTIATKTTAHRFDPSADDHLRAEPVPAARQRTPAPDDAAVAAVAELARRCADHFGRPQDIEWALDASGELFLLQSRPITSLASLTDPDGEPCIWDNSNIAESYGGITSPLTFSFARRAYAGVYRQFCHLMGVPKREIADADVMFSRMLGLVEGRVYYNLLNWYRLLAMLPGFAANRAFMEQMMGVRQALPEDLVNRILAERPKTGRTRDRLRVGRSLAGLAVNYLTLPRQIRRFYVRLEECLRPPAVPFERMRLDELTAEFRRLERRLLTRWDAPLVNDFFAMVFFGVLGKLCARWCGERGTSLHNDLIREGGDIISAEPARRITAMAELAARDPALVDALCNADPRAARRAVGRMPQLAAEYEAYVARFGDRCLEELKLESSTLADDPTPLLRAVGHAARRRPEASPSPAGGAGRFSAEQAARQHLSGHPVRQAVFKWVLRNARSRVRDRENLRFERTRLFGRVRRIFVEAGRRLWADGRLEEPRDVFYLEVDEILGHVEGTATVTDLAALAQLRREQYERLTAQASPPDRFTTRGAAQARGAIVEEATTGANGEAETAGMLRGTPCCAGRVRGRVRVIRDPRGARLEEGEILVAERTDPGWIMLFPAAAGILVERGSLLSHSAIVAREMGIPAIVAIADLTRRLQTGQFVEFDGATGEVRVVGPDAEDAPGDPIPDSTEVAA